MRSFSIQEELLLYLHFYKIRLLHCVRHVTKQPEIQSLYCARYQRLSKLPMLLMVDGNSELGVHVQREIGDLIFLRQLIEIGRIFVIIIIKDLFSFMRAQHCLSSYKNHGPSFPKFSVVIGPIS